MLDPKTPTNPRLYSKAEGEAAREKGIDRSADGAGALWMQKALDTILRVAQQKAEFTSDDLWPLLSDAPGDPRALGAAIRHASWLKLCAPTNRVTKSLRVACHRRPIAIWKSLVYVGAGA